MHVGTMWCHCRLVAFDDYLELSLLMLPLLLSDYMSELMPDLIPMLQYAHYYPHISFFRPTIKYLEHYNYFLTIISSILWQRLGLSQ